MFNLQVNRTLTAIIAETTNRSMGGKGVIDYIMKVLPLATDEKKSLDLTPEQISNTLKHYREMRAKRNGRGTENNN